MENCATLYYKACLHLGSLSRQTPDELIRNIQYTILDHLCFETNLQMHCQTFLNHGFFATQDSRFKINTTSISDPATKTLEAWALRVQMFDPEHGRRTWNTHLGLVPDLENQLVKLHFAMYYYDHTAGMYGLLPPPKPGVPAMFRALLAHGEFAQILGDYVLPPDPIKLAKATSDMFLDLLFNPRRTVPLVVVTCPDSIHADTLADQLMGNAVVFSATSPISVNYVNKLLNNIDLAIPKGSVKVYRDAKNDTVLNRTHSQDDISSRGEAAFLNILRRAYCERFRSEDRRSFVSVDYIQDCIARRKLKEKDAAIESLTASAAAHERRCRELQEELELAQAYLSRDLVGEIREHENLLSLCMKESDVTREQIISIAHGLYEGCAGNALLTSMPSCAEIAHLLEALRFRLASQTGGRLSVQHTSYDASRQKKREVL